MSETKKARYVSRFSALRLVMEPAWTEVVNGRAITHPGRSIQFVEGLYETSDKDEIEYLDAQEKENGAGTVVRANIEPAQAREELLKTLEDRNAELEAENERLRREGVAVPRETGTKEVQTHSGTGGAEKTVVVQEGDPAFDDVTPAAKPARAARKTAAKKVARRK